MRLALDNYVGRESVGDRIINNLLYADYTTLLANRVSELENVIERVIAESEEFGLVFNVSKIKGADCQPTGRKPTYSCRQLSDYEIIKQFNFLGFMTSN